MSATIALIGSAALATPAEANLDANLETNLDANVSDSNALETSALEGTLEANSSEATSSEANSSRLMTSDAVSFNKPGLGDSRSIHSVFATSDSTKIADATTNPSVNSPAHESQLSDRTYQTNPLHQPDPNQSDPNQPNLNQPNQSDLLDQIDQIDRWDNR